MTESEFCSYLSIGDVPRFKDAVCALKACIPMLEYARLEMQSMTSVMRTLRDNGEFETLEDCQDSDDADMDLRDAIKIIDKLSEKYGV